MNGKKIVLVMIAVFALGMLVLPRTVSLFAGEHIWYDLGSKGNDVPCEKCHADIADEMNSLISVHTGETGYGRMKCEYCHRTFDLNDYGGWPSQNINQSIFSKYYYTYASVDGASAQPRKEAHAASTVPCMYCHSGEDVGNVHPPTFTAKYCSCHGTDDGGDPNYYHGDRFYTGTSNTDPGECIKCHGTGDGSSKAVIYIPPAGGFNLTTNSTDTGSMAAHKTFVLNAISNKQMEDANEACIACHTHVPVRINWTHRVSLEFNVTPEFSLPPTHFNVSNWNVNGTANSTVWGNTTGNGTTVWGNIAWPGENPGNYIGGGYT